MVLCRQQLFGSENRCNQIAGECEVVRVGPDIFSAVLTGVGVLLSEPGETFGKAGEG